MKTTLAILAATTALGALFALTSLDGARAGNRATTLSDDHPASWVQLISGDDDDEEDEDEDCMAGGDDDDDDDEGHDDDDEGDDDTACLPAQNAAPAGTVAPPANGLFGNGTPPKVQVN